MLTIKRIYLDLDDVLTHFTMHALAYLGCKVDTKSYRDYPQQAGYNLAEAANLLLKKEVFAPDTIWREFPRSFWADVPPSDDLGWLIDEAASIAGKEGVCILTCPTDDPECLAGKLQWIHRNLPWWLHREYLIGPPKFSCARHDALLIDDSPRNCTAFRKAGGMSWLVPRPWNELGHRNTRRSLEARFWLCKHNFDESPSILKRLARPLQAIGLVPKA